MKNYSKLFGSIIGGLIGLGVSKGVIPAEAQDPEVVAALTTLVCAAVATWAFPANKAA
ncbi:hypothetical protein [Marinovum algicola]|uniref:hypothetical protein n=1 Tax=Marinovum algicola TaxID=42444 RepID=UPI003B515C2B